MTDTPDAPRVLVCGSRRNREYADVCERLDRLPPATVIIEGGCQGVDQQAARIAGDKGWGCITVPAKWNEHGCAAGPLRNQEMIDMKPDLVLAFPDARSVGTLDTIRRARKAGIPVEVIHV